MKIDVDAINTWQTATKIKNIMAKPITPFNMDEVIFEKLILETLEGNIRLSANTVVCADENGHTWIQTPKALLRKYDIIDINIQGWLVCKPKLENEVYCIQVTTDMITTSSDHKDFYIIGLWGQDSPEGPRQYGHIGDYICKNPLDPNDKWIVKRGIFEATYQIK